MTRPRPPARSTTSAVMTLVMLAIGRLVSSARLHSTVPVEAFSTAAPLACTAGGATRWAAGAATAAGAARAVWAGTAQTMRTPLRTPLAAAARARRPGRRILLPVIRRLL